MWLEWRHATQGAVISADDPRWVCAFDVDLSVLDLRDPATRRALRVGLGAVTGPWAPDRPNRSALRIASVARQLDVDGVVVPSAARDGGWNLAVFPSAFDRVRLVSRRRHRPPSE
jgi:RES domain-containing protein